MEGLIKQQMAPQQEPMPEDAAAAPAPGNEDPEDNPGFGQAMAYVMEVLYEKGADENIAKSLRGQQDVVEALANTAYEITSIVDERTEGAVPDELFALLATRILEEVAEIGEAAGMDIKPSEIALALKQMILRFLGEQGMDTTQLQQAMDQVDPEEFNRMATEEMPA